MGNLSSIVKAYDIRGVVPDQLNEGVAEAVGAAFARLTGAATIVTLHDMRASSAPLADAFGRVERKLGKLDIAKKTLTEAAKGGWRTPRYDADLAQIYFDTNDTLNALSYFEKALSSNADHPVAMIGRARAGIGSPR